MCVSVCWYAHVSAAACGDRKRAPGTLQLEFQSALSCLTWILGTELESCWRAADARDH